MKILDEDLEKYKGKEIYIVSVDHKDVSVEHYLYTTEEEAKETYEYLEKTNQDKRFTISYSRCLVENDLTLLWC